MIDISLNFDNLINYVREEINRYTSMNLNGLGFSQQELNNNKAQIQKIVTNIRKSCSGDLGAREMTKEVVKDKIDKVVTENNLDQFILFDEFATPWTMFEAICYRANHPLSITDMFNFVEKSNDPLKQGKKISVGEKRGSIGTFFKEFPNETTITERQLRNFYNEHNLRLTYADKIRILTQMVFASCYGLGVIDTLNYQQDTIEEIHLGMAGVLNQSYDYRTIISGDTSQLGNHARDKIHVVIEGRTIALSFLSFKDNHELKRVIRNLVKDAGAGDLTEANPRIKTDTIDGRRITVARPPYQDSWGGLIRKFGNVSIKTIKDWDKESTIVDDIRMLIRCGANISITGEMETGKTTFLRGLLAETDATKNIRVVEKDAFELNARRYLPGRNASSFKIGENFTEEDVLAYVRRTTGHIFAVGEVNSLELANILCNLAKVVPQVVWTSHHNETSAIIDDFKNAKLKSGFSSERLAEMEAASVVNINIKVGLINGTRRVLQIDEIIPEMETMPMPNNVEEGLSFIQKQMDKTSTYRINPIIQRAEDGTYKRMNPLSASLSTKAKYFMNAEDYLKFCEWNSNIPDRERRDT